MKVRVKTFIVVQNLRSGVRNFLQHYDKTRQRFYFTRDVGKKLVMNKETAEKTFKDLNKIKFEIPFELTTVEFVLEEES